MIIKMYTDVLIHKWFEWNKNMLVPEALWKPCYFWPCHLLEKLKCSTIYCMDTQMIRDVETCMYNVHYCEFVISNVIRYRNSLHHKKLVKYHASTSIINVIQIFIQNCIPNLFDCCFLIIKIKSYVDEW